MSIGHSRLRGARGVRFRAISLCVGTFLAVSLFASARPAAAASDWVPGVETAADAKDNFSASPRTSKNWLQRGTWYWDGKAKYVNSAPSGTCSLIWQRGIYYAGAFSLKFRMIPQRTPSKVTLMFDYDKAKKSYRFVTLTAGSPGTVVIGQQGTILGLPKRTFKTVKVTIKTAVWNKVGVVIDKGQKLAVSLNGRKIATVTAPKFPVGQVGLLTTASKVSFDDFLFMNTPDSEPCQDCHAGQAAQAPAPNVYTYWNGAWWDRYRQGSPRVQQGGHGDPGGQPALTCTGATGCHNLRLPTPAGHRNGIREGAVASATVNSYHLRAEYFNPSASSPEGVAVAFDKFCFEGCHKSLVAKGVLPRDMRMQSNGLPYLKLGAHLTWSDGRNIPPAFPLDSDISSRASPGEPIYAPCDTCHDPHGTGSDAVSGPSNRMLRLRNGSALCEMCHR